MNYPDDWLCERCCRPFHKHLKEGEFNGSSMPNARNWCFDEVDGIGDHKYKWYFQPMDNLNYTEKVAEDKGIIEENTPAKEPLNNSYEE